MARLSSLAFLLALVAGSAAALDLTPGELAGRTLFRTGIGHSGEPVKAFVGPRDAPMPGNLMPCANCHGQDATGRPEGGVVPPEITWSELSKPYGHRHEPASGGPARVHPAFTEASFVAALTRGVDPAGNRLDPSMPRYRLSTTDLANLRAYLMRVAEDRDPGVLEGVIRIGTLLPQDGPLAPAAQAVEAILRAAFSAANAAGGVHGRKVELQIIDAGNSVESGRAALGTIAADGIFAVVAPLAPAIDNELSRFSEEQALPLIGMIASSDVEDAGRYCWHLIGGGLEQASAVAEFAVSDLSAGKAPAAVVVGPGARHAAQADRITAQFAAPGAIPPSRENLQSGRAGQLVPALQLRAVETVFFLGGAHDLGEFLGRAEEAGFRPRVLVPEPISVRVQPDAASRIFIAAPLLPADFGVELNDVLARNGQRGGVLSAAAWGVATTTLEGLKRAGRAITREKFRNALDSLQGFRSGATPPITFGAGRRVGTGGAWVLPLRPPIGDKPGAGRFVEIDKVAS